MSIAAKATLNVLESHLLATGLFARVNTHEPKNAPDTGLTAALFINSIGPVQSSGLANTSALVVYMCRLYVGMINEPQDDIDPNLAAALDTIFTALSADFELGGNARNIDLLGQSGQTLSGQAGYVTIGSTMYRVFDITIPIISNDAWGQAR